MLWPSTLWAWVLARTQRANAASPRFAVSSSVEIAGSFS
jgi:hypothetical protein